ncbi:MAG: polyphosphate kinase 1 [Acidimicrobiales bacterium]
MRELDIDDDAVYTLASPLDLSGLWSVHALDKPDLADPVWVPVHAPAGDRRGRPVDRLLPRELRQGDLLILHHPDSFTTSVEAFIRQASIDPKVLAIKLTLYRTTRDSSIIESLIRAAERGKQVVALVELKARFDEQRNIEWARELENAGVHVVYGLVGLKTHTKTTLVVRDETDGVRRYCHIGTGNYNPRTARLYEDLGLLTADRSIGEDLTQLFNFLTGYARDTVYDKLLVAPRDIRPGLVELVRNEMRHGTEGRIVLKMNSLVDPDLIDVLYEASAAGVQIDCIVRGICCLRAEVPGLSEHIRVRSIIGRFLEHARVYHFAHGADGEPVFLMGSADLMPRNLDRRVEALVPIEAPELRDEVAEVLRVNLDDDVLAWRLLDDVWTQVPTVEGIDTHVRLQELALQRRRSAG